MDHPVSDSETGVRPRTFESDARATAIAAVLYLAITAALFWNVLPHLTTHIYSDPGDPLLNAAILGWNAQTLPLTSAWWNFPAFAPLSGVTAFTEHLLVTYPIATPLIWLTGNAGFAYNVVLLLAFAANGLAMFALAREVVGSSSAAFLAGLAFAVAPYQAAQLSHLQMLLASGMPLALLGLHRFVERHRRGGLALFAAGWLVTALSNAYMLVFFPCLVALWSAWFVRPREWRTMTAIAGVGAGVGLAIGPLLWSYHVRQSAYGLLREYGGIKELSADITYLAAVTHRAWLWRPLLPQAYDEVALFPGLTIAALALLGVCANLTLDRTRTRQWSALLFSAAALCAIAAFGRAWVGPEAWRIGDLRLPAFRPYRVVTFAVLLSIASLVTTRRVRAAWGRRDAAVFYIGAAAAMWLLALGPEPSWAGARALTYGPYRLLLELPAMQAIRVPARAWVAGMLCLAMAAGFGAAALIARWPRRQRVILPLLAVGIIAEGWFHEGIAELPPPAPVMIPRGALVLELPIGDVVTGTAAEYAAIGGGYRLVNGYSGYDPPHYAALRRSVADHQDEVLDRFRRLGDLYVILQRDADSADLRWVERQTGVQWLAQPDDRRVYRLRYLGTGPPPALPLPLGASVAWSRWGE